MADASALSRTEICARCGFDCSPDQQLDLFRDQQRGHDLYQVIDRARNQPSGKLFCSLLCLETHIEANLPGWFAKHVQSGPRTNGRTHYFVAIKRDASNSIYNDRVDDV